MKLTEEQQLILDMYNKFYTYLDIVNQKDLEINTFFNSIGWKYGQLKGQLNMKRFEVNMNLTKVDLWQKSVIEAIQAMPKEVNTKDFDRLKDIIRTMQLKHKLIHIYLDKDYDSIELLLDERFNDMLLSKYKDELPKLSYSDKDYQLWDVLKLIHEVFGSSIIQRIVYD